MKLKKFFERFYRKWRGVETVNCSTCPFWEYHSTLPGHRKSKLIQEGATFRLERDTREPFPERWGACMKGRIVAVPMEGVGAAIRATMAGDVCAQHPNYDPARVVGAADLVFKPGVGAFGGFDRPPSLREAMAYGRLRPQHLPPLGDLENFGKEFRGEIPLGLGVQFAVETLKAEGQIPPDVNGPENEPPNGDAPKPNGS